MRFHPIVYLAFISLIGFQCTQKPVTYDVVISGGQLIDPATQTNAILNIGINDDSVAIVSGESLDGRKIIDAAGLVVAPGFIDIHSHTPTPLGQYFQLHDGVTSSLDLEAGAHPQEQYGLMLGDSALINYGASVAHFAVRIKALEDRDIPYLITSKGSAIKPTPAFTQVATAEQIDVMRKLLHQGIDQGGIGIGLLLDYMNSAVSDDELNMVFEVSGERKAPIWVHTRRGVQGDPAGLDELLVLAKKHKAPLHICHIQGNSMGQIATWISKIEEANRAGADVTMEMYPYTAGSTSISADVFDRDWQNIFGTTYENIQWSSTGEYLTKATWEKYRQEQPTGTIIHHYGKEEWIRTGLKHPNVMYGSDAMPVISLKSKVTPRGIGTYSKILSDYVREEHLMTLSDAINKMTYLPAKRLELIAPSFLKKGRISPGSDADIVIFNPATIEDHATYESPFQESTGFAHILIAGQEVLTNDKIIPRIRIGRHLSKL